MSYLLASIVWAVTAKLSPDVERYFLAQFVYTIAIDAGMRFLGTKSPYYAAIYSSFTLLIIASMFGIIARKTKGYIPAWMAGVLISFICFVALPRPLHYYNFISLAEGMTLTTCGALLIFNTRKPLYLTLAVLWISLAAWRLCYVLRMESPAWRDCNLWLPASFCIAAFTAIGFSQRRAIHPSRP